MNFFPEHKHTQTSPTCMMSASEFPSTTNRGLLFVCTERGPSISEDEFEEWYNDEHIPLRLNLPGPLFLGCTRWTAADDKTPTHLALYDLASPTAILKPPYVALSTSRSPRELDILAKHELLDRRVYVPLPVPSEHGVAQKGGYDARSPGPYISVVELKVKDDPGAEAELNKWYDEEHIPMLMEVPGWVRSRRFVANRVLSVTGTSVDSDMLVPRAVPGKYIAVHEWATLEAFETEAFKRATSTSGSLAKVLDSGVVVKHERRVFKFFRSWETSEL